MPPPPPTLSSLPSPSPPPFNTDTLSSLFSFLGTAKDVAHDSYVNHTWKEAADADYTQQEQADEPWFSLVCARFSEEVMGPIVEAMKDEKEKMKNKQEEGGKSGTETVSAGAATTSITMTMTPKRLWEECNKARQTKS